MTFDRRLAYITGPIVQG